MPMSLFECACVAVVALTLFTMARARAPSAVLRDYALLAAAAWLGEDTCVAFYGYYAYATGWHVRLHHVPVLVPLIWPLVVLSAREVVSTLWPALGAARLARAAAVGALVVFDASLVEVVAVRAGLWSWAEGGHLGVPVIGMLGWGYFALGADLALSRARPLAVIVAAPLTAHVMIVTTWWALFRWTLRGPLGGASVLGVVVVSLVALSVVLVARRRGAAIPFDVAMPRMIAAALFVALLVGTAPADVPLWTHAVAVALPYLVATEWPFTGRRSTAGRRAATPRSPR